MAVEELTNGNDDGSRMGQSATELLAFYGADPVAQQTSTGDVPTTAPASTEYGFLSELQCDALVELVNDIKEALQNVGILA